MKEAQKEAADAAAKCISAQQDDARAKVALYGIAITRGILSCTCMHEHPKSPAGTHVTELHSNVTTTTAFSASNSLVNEKLRCLADPERVARTPVTTDNDVT